MHKSYTVTCHLFGWTPVIVLFPYALQISTSPAISLHPLHPSWTHLSVSSLFTSQEHCPVLHPVDSMRTKLNPSTRSQTAYHLLQTRPAPLQPRLGSNIDITRRKFAKDFNVVDTRQLSQEVKVLLEGCRRATIVA